MGRTAGDVDHRGLDAHGLEEVAHAHGSGHRTVGGGDAAVGGAGAHGQHGGRVGAQLAQHGFEGDFLMIGLADHAVAAVLPDGHRALGHHEELPLFFLGHPPHIVDGGLALVGHEGGMEVKADDLQQHVGNGRMGAVEKRHGTARATLPLQPEDGRTFARQGFGQSLPDGGVEHAGNPVTGHRARAEFDKIAPGETHDASLEEVRTAPATASGNPGEG